ncbi:hypothetical protein I8752_13220 [Nostocaceae cyanobacterium CENA369]|uniref:Uncharacterized protein n=1 Tax=Dendronalium phyllosphericum CENA369 TaxID=1725256 RepID=A0A8J7I5V3_9NOST|nr:hypothetical protein [Dendronalium phyllosphericum]MBH8573965.1 hypothetical protein [Dendronalium phyllosphericum CENA369]
MVRADTETRGRGDTGTRDNFKASKINGTDHYYIEDSGKFDVNALPIPKIRDRLLRLCLNSSAKMPKFILSSIRDALHQGKTK